MIILPWHFNRTTTGLDASASISHASSHARRSALAWGVYTRKYRKKCKFLMMGEMMEMMIHAWILKETYLFTQHV